MPKFQKLKSVLNKLGPSGLYFRAKSHFFYLKIRWSRDSRPSSYPYLSGDSFRKISDHFYDETKKDKPENVKDGEIVFVKADYLTEYFRDFHPKVKYPYKLISHNSDYNITEKDLGHIDNKIIHWYGQNVLVSHPKLTPLPIGLENLYIYVNGITKNFDYWRKHLPTNKKTKMLFGFNKYTNLKEREVAERILEKNTLADKIKKRLNPDNYIKLLSQYKFMASPPGNGLDCIGAWEAMHVKTIPIVKKSVMTQYFKKIKLPLLLIDDWSELSELEERDLGRIYTEIYTQSDDSALFMDYWINKIKKGDD